ncbi:O-antigen ligase family protein [Microbacterium sp.]|uniref:O-antigen ligase family protein n=1 Tax=Microbacterium sp. TaxID=51671 RepID=UPI003A90F7E5
MAVISKHPAAPVPSAPVREKTRHIMLRGWCIFVLFLALSGVSWVNAIGTDAVAAVTVLLAVVSVVLWFLVRPPVNWRRLPWFVVAYIVWAGLSMAWSAWLGVSALTWALLIITTLQGLFVAAMLTWREVVRAVGSALKWCLGLSIVFELFVAVFVRGPVLPGFVIPDQRAADPIVYWCRGNLFNGGRIQGIFGSANPLAAVCLLAIIVFAIRIADRAPRRIMFGAWIVLAAYLMYRASSATIYLAAVAVLAVLCAALVMRRAKTPSARARRYAVFAVVGAVVVVVAWLGRDAIFSALGRSSSLTGRSGIWQAVIDRAAERPGVGWGFATPWVTGDPHFDGWIIDHGQSVMQAHNVWLDVWMQLGVVGIVLLGLVYLSFLWRAWFFAVDRPRWDLRDDRPYSPLTLVPTLVGTLLLVQGLAESEPLLLWGWMFVAMLAFKIKQSPHVGVGPIEQRVAIERGERITEER